MIVKIHLKKESNIMRTKYIFEESDGAKFALRFDSNSNQLMIAGKRTNVNLLHETMIDIFKIPDFNTENGGKWAIKFFGVCTLKKYLEGYQRLSDCGIYGEKVSTFGRMLY